MKNIINELIPISTNSENEPIVSGRELYAFLKIKERFSKWFDRHLEFGFQLDIDYTPYQMVHPRNKQEFTDYAMTLDMAKEVSMLQRNEKGKEARQYFIQVEKFYKQGVVYGDLEHDAELKYTFKNQPVATVKQIADMYGCDGSTIRHYAKSNLKYGADYLVLSGKDLKCFKAENPRPELTMVGCLTVLFESAVEKVSKYLVTLGYKFTTELEKECDRLHKAILKAFSSDERVSEVRSFDKGVVMEFLKADADQQIITMAKLCAQRDLILYENFRLKSFLGDVSDKMSVFKNEAKQLEQKYLFNVESTSVKVSKYSF